MAKIQFTDKEDLTNDPTVAEKNKVRAADINEIKAVVNQNDDAALSEIYTDSSISGTGSQANPLSVSADLEEITSTGNESQTPIIMDETYIQFNPVTSDPGHLEGRIFYDGKTMRIYDDIPDTSIDIGKELVIDVYNDNGSTLTNFTAVRVSGVNGGNPSVVRAQADTVENASGLLICTHDIAVGQVGKATAFGTADGDTSAWNVNDLLYLDSTTPGLITNVPQEISSIVGRVLVSDAVNGLLFIYPRGVVNPTTIGQVSGLNKSDTMTATPASVLAYDNTTAFEQNTNVVFSGSDPYSASISPDSVAATGFYSVNFSAAITGTANTVHNFELYINGTPSGVVGKVDVSNNQIDAGSVSITAITQSKISNTDVIEVYGYTDAGTSTVLYESAIFNIDRIGNA